MILNLGTLLFLLLTRISDSLMDNELNYEIPVNQQQPVVAVNPSKKPMMMMCRPIPLSQVLYSIRYCLIEEEPVISSSSAAVKNVEERYIVKATPKEPSPTIEMNVTEEKVEEKKQKEVAASPSSLTVEDKNKTDDIPSFREWTQKALEEEKKKKEESQKKKEQNASNLDNSGVKNPKINQVPENANGDKNQTSAPIPPSSGTKEKVNRLKKNYASVDCGAKVVSSNPESQGASNIISPSRDEYVLNKCTDKAWFVIELCESIKALRIEIANFELYSSVPKEFRVTLSNVFPSRDWVHFGNFEAKDLRDVQSFETSLEGVYGKYVKVEILSHYGSEHYCPISLFRMYGISEIELMAQGDDDDGSDDDVVIPEIAAVVPPESEEKKSKDIVSFIKEKVDETIEKMVGVFRSKSKKASDESDGRLLQTFIYEISCPDCDVQRLRDVTYLLSINYAELKDILRTRLKIVSRICYNLGFPGFEEEKTSCLGLNLIEFYKTLFGSSHLMALCNVIIFEGNKAIRVNNNTLISDNYTKTEGMTTPPNDSFVVEEETIAPTPVKVDNNQTVSTSSSSSSSSIMSGMSSENDGTSHQSNDTISTLNTTTLPDPPSVVHIPPVVSNGESVPSQRESVWQKLTNRIKSLERNVTLSSGYLEELSVLYKKQIEDLQMSVRHSGETLSLALRSAEDDRREQVKLEGQIKELTFLVLNLTAQIDRMLTWTIGIHVGFLLLEILIGFYLFALCREKTKVLISSTLITRRRQSLEENPKSLDFGGGGGGSGSGELSRKQRKRLLQQEKRRLNQQVSEKNGGDNNDKDKVVENLASSSSLTMTTTAKKRKYLRSKSTSPTRKSEGARQRVFFKNFNPDNANWINNNQKEL